MRSLVAFLSLLVRMVRPARGVHAPAFGYLREVLTEAGQRRRSRRVRKYALDVPTVAEAAPVRVPAPRRSLDAAPARNAFASLVPAVQADAVAEPADLVRPYFRDYERRRDVERADRSRLGVAVALEIAQDAAEVSA